MYLLTLIAASVILIIALTAWARWHPVWALLAACLLVGWGSGQNSLALISTIGGGFGSLVGKIGLVIVLGAVLGLILERTGGTIRLADALVALLGKRFPALTVALIGAIVSIPVFCDSGFIILSRLNKAIAKRTNIAPASLFLALAGGLYLTHNLVPPTPGPVAAAGNLGASASLGTQVIFGLLLSIPILLVARWWSKRQGPKITLTEPSITAVDIEEPALPALGRVLPSLVIPIFLLAVGSLFDQPIIKFLGQPIPALAIGVLLGFLLLAWPQRTQWSAWTQEGIVLAGPILVITGLGGSFGAVLVASGIKEVITEAFASSQPSVLLLLLSAFGIAAVLKTAQGSSTSALVVGSAVLAPIAASLGLTDPLALSLLISALGCGAMVVSHANDSYFWVVSQFSGLSVTDAYRHYSTLTLWMGLTGLLVCLTVGLFVL